MKYGSYKNLSLIFLLGWVSCYSEASVVDSKELSIPIKGDVVAVTCDFKKTLESVELNDIAIDEFTSDIINNEKPVTVNFDCGLGVNKNVKLQVNGTADTEEPSAFVNQLANNSGGAKNVGLRVLDINRNVLSPGDKVDYGIPVASTDLLYTFTVGYVETVKGKADSGDFSSSFTIKFLYD